MTTPPEALREMGADFIYAANALAETMERLKQGREARLKFLRQCITDETSRLAKLKEEVRTLPEQIAKWEAERARLESQTGLDLLREVVAETPTSGELVYTAKPPGQVLVDGKPEDPFVPGLPPLRLREVWAEWEQERGPVYRFEGHSYQVSTDPSRKWYAVTGAWEARYRPHGKTRAEVEKMAEEREKMPEAPCPICGHAIHSAHFGARIRCPGCEVLLEMVLADGRVLPCEVTGGAVLEVAADRKPAPCTCAPGRVTFLICDGCKDMLPQGLWTQATATPQETRRAAEAEIEAFLAASGRAPKAADKPALLDLRGLKVGTVCEATGEILTYLGRRIKPGEVFRIFEPDDGMGDKHPTIIEIEFACSSVPALVPARVVEEPK